MRISKITAAVIATSVVAGFLAESSTAQTNNRAPATFTSSGTTKTSSQFQFILFYKQNDAATQQMSGVLKTAVERHSGQATYTQVNLADPTSKPVADRYGVSRAPMPMVLCVAANGAVTGAFPRQLDEQGIERAMVTPAMTDVVKTLQDKKLVVVHFKPAANTPVPIGAVEFMADPAFQAKTKLIEVVAGDPTEARFFTDLEVNTKGEVPALLVLAPPGVLVGKFPATVTKDQIGEKVHAAGQCCNDPNCKHNKKAKKLCRPTN